MTGVFWIAAVVAIVSTLMVVTRLNAIHAVLYLIISLLSVAVIFLALGAPFVAALEVIIYAGAIMVLFVFVVMLLNLGQVAVQQESRWLSARAWIGPSLLAVILLGELVYVLTGQPAHAAATTTVEPKQVGIALFGPYLVGTELAGILLRGGLVGAFHIGRQDRRQAA